MKIKFSELDKEIQMGRCTIPQAVFVTLDPDDETIEQVMERQEKFLKLPEDIKNKLVSRETAEKIKAIGAHYNLELLQMAPIARAIRSYYFKEVKLDDFADIISRESKIGIEKAQNIARYVKDRIIIRDMSKAIATPTVKMTILQALEKYPEIQNQILTTYPIEIEGQMMRPSIGNWRLDYLGVVGAGNRDVMKRSSYLYHSRNVKNLNVVDRQKLSSVLKSLDEGLVFKIDPEKREVIFDNMATNRIIATKANQKIEQPNYQRPTLMARDGEARIQRKVSEVEKTVEMKPLNKNLNSVEDKNETIINHIQGNKWDLKSAHFIKRNEFDDKMTNDNSNIQFSSPQQLPVEKEKDLNKPDFGDREPNGGKSLKDFFGKIEPIE